MSAECPCTVWAKIASSTPAAVLHWLASVHPVWSCTSLSVLECCTVGYRCPLRPCLPTKRAVLTTLKAATCMPHVSRHGLPRLDPTGARLVSAMPANHRVDESTETCDGSGIPIARTKVPRTSTSSRSSAESSSVASDPLRSRLLNVPAAHQCNAPITAVMVTMRTSQYRTSSRRTAYAVTHYRQNVVVVAQQRPARPQPFRACGWHGFQ